MTNKMPNNEDYEHPNDVVDAFHAGMLDDGRTQMLRSIMDLLSIIGRFYKGSNDVTQATIVALVGSYLKRMASDEPLPNIDLEEGDE